MCFFKHSWEPLLRYISEISAKNPKSVATAFDKVLETGLTMDPKLIQAAVAAHDKALDNAINNPGLVTFKADWAAVNEALARMIGSADAGKFKALLTAFPQNADLQMALFAANNPVDAKAWEGCFFGCFKWWSKGVRYITFPEFEGRQME